MSLDQTTAQFRADLIRAGNTTYNFNIILDIDQYYGLAELNFYLEHLNFTQLMIDSINYLVEQVAVNNKKLVPKRDDNFIYISKDQLQKGKNRVSVMYVNKYDKDRRGCMKFSADGEQYVYTKFEPYGAHKVFPCFDQPDIKASMKISVAAPQEWLVASNQPPAVTLPFHPELYKGHAKLEHSASNDLLDRFLGNSRIKANTKVTLFDYSKVISTYLFVFAAGPYVFKDSPEGSGTVPMRLYSARASQGLLNKYSQFIFDIVQKAMAFFEEFFSEKYPFPKYDQIFVRDFQSSAMENAGLVAFREERFLLEYSTQDDYYNFASTLVHELSHHWFGNLVTMKWWDDLWLNESFADFIADFTLRKINDSLLNKLQPSGMYFRYRKAWGYDEDERNSATHPIRAQVTDTDVAVSIFDGITYSKGAGTLKQLMFLVGEQNFKKAIQKYMDRFRHSNATIEDLLADLKDYFPAQVSIDNWKSSWLESPSLNVFESVWDPSNVGQSATLKLYQYPFSSDYNTLRWHKFQVAFFDENASIVDEKTVLVSPTTNLTQITYDGTNEVKAIFVNYNDEDFLENYIDSQSLQFFLANIEKIKDDLTRSLIWFNLSQLNKQTLMRLDDYVSFIVEKLFDEPQIYVINQLLTELFVYLSSFLVEQNMVAETTVIFDAIYKKLQDETIVDVDKLEVFYKNLLKYAQTDAQILKLKDWIMGDDPTLAGRQIQDKSLYWSIVKKIFSVADSSLSVEEKESVFNAIKDQIDNKDWSDAAEAVCKVILSTKEEFDTIYKRLAGPDDDLTTRNILIEGWKNRYHQEWVDLYYQQYFNDLVPLSTELPYAFYQFFYQFLKPSTKNYEDQISRYNVALEKLKLKPNMTAHVVAITKMVDDLILFNTNMAFNADSNSTLTQERSVDRYSYIKDGSVSYISHIGFEALSQQNAGETFGGLTQVTFELTALPKLLPLDFSCKNLLDIVINGAKANITLTEDFILIPRVYLQIGVNHITVRYVNNFSNDGYGCISFIDTTSTPNKFYAYTHMEPYSAHKVFPCFDQPDLKAQLSLSMIMPVGWVGVANGAVNYQNVFSEADYTVRTPDIVETQVLKDYLQGRSGYFYVYDQTEPISTYLYCLVAGEYVERQLAEADRYNKIPMKVYSLASYEPALDRYKDFIFQITKLSLEFYQGKFGVSYPFKKYDTVFCHEYAIGAMENPGVITFNDARFLVDAVVSQDQMLDFAQVIAHECSHNWFGDLVTMKWFDDTWLKESFADFMAFSCLEGIKDKVTTIPTYSTGWMAGLKRAVGGYLEDQLSTTHPVRSVVPNTNLAKVYFDAITYRKGMMTLKQLFFIMGEENFYKGVNKYFTNFAWSNGTIDDFLNSISEFYVVPGSNYTLENWKQMWLEESSLNVLSVTWDPSSVSPNSKLSINQTYFSEDYPLLRYHKVNIAFFKADGSYITKTVVVQNAASTQVEYDGSQGFKAILVNEGHRDFVKCAIDTDSLAWFQTNINNINKGETSTDNITRMTIWFYMNQMVRDGRTKLLTYRDVILNVLSGQTEDFIFGFELSFLNQATSQYLPITYRSESRSAIFTFVMDELTSFTQRKALAKEKQQNSKQTYYPGSRMMAREFQTYEFSKGMKKIEQEKVKDQDNRIILLKDMLPVFCSTNAQLETLEAWREGAEPTLVNYPINETQAWAVVKLIYASSNYTSTRKLQILDDQESSTPGILAQLARNTATALDSDAEGLQNIYDKFIKQDISVGIKNSYAAGWNNLVHLTALKDIYKQKIFNDMPALSKTLSISHFTFFYTGLAPIDDDLATTIALYEGVNLKGGAMIGHINNIRKITDGYKLRQKLYEINQ